MVCLYANKPWQSRRVCWLSIRYSSFGGNVFCIVNLHISGSAQLLLAHQDIVSPCQGSHSSSRPLNSLKFILAPYSLEFCVKTLKFVKDTKNRSTHFLSLNFILFWHQPFFRKIIDTSLECCIDKKKFEINGTSH